jgi:hypothetical protein
MHQLDAESELSSDDAVTEVIRPAALVPPDAARDILRELAWRDVSRGGLWMSTPTLWSRYDDSILEGSAGPRQAVLVGGIQIAYGTPSRFEITIYRATITTVGTEAGWTVSRMCDEALAFGGLSLRTCPRADLHEPPRPFLFRS